MPAVCGRVVLLACGCGCSRCTLSTGHARTPSSLSRSTSHSSVTARITHSNPARCPPLPAYLQHHQQQVRHFFPQDVTPLHTFGPSFGGCGLAFAMPPPPLSSILGEVFINNQASHCLAEELDFENNGSAG
jgi:hypothetical protein